MGNNVVWLAILRGAVEKAIDNTLSKGFLSALRIFFNGMKPTIKNDDGVLFGFVYGHVIGKIDNIYANLNREATKEELDEILNAIKKRNMEIKSLIYQTKT